MTGYTAKRARTRGQLLDAGQELLPGAVRRGLEHALGPGPVSQRADVSRQTWYRYWRADDSAYLDDLLRSALDTILVTAAPRLDSAARTPDPTGAADAVARAHAALVTQHRVVLAHLVGAVLALEDRVLEDEAGTRPTSAPEILRTFHSRLHAVLAAAYGTVLDRWNRRPRRGLDLDAIVDLVEALADGFALRGIVDPETAGAEAFAPAAVELLLRLTDPA